MAAYKVETKKIRFYFFAKIFAIIYNVDFSFNLLQKATGRWKKGKICQIIFFYDTRFLQIFEKIFVYAKIIVEKFVRRNAHKKRRFLQKRKCSGLFSLKPYLIAKM